MYRQANIVKPHTKENIESYVSYNLKTFVFWGLNALLAIVVQEWPVYATVHAYLTLLVGLFFLLADKNPHRLICWMGYLVGVEIFWRGTKAAVFWEMGKYALILFSFLGLMKFTEGKKPKLAIVIYFLLLVPSLFLMPSFNRETIAFNLAGPFTLMMSVLFFDQVSINQRQLKALLLAVLSSVLIFSTLVLLGVISAEIIEFGHGSLFLTSANTGPNQVSSILSLGAFAAIVFVVLEKKNHFLRILVFLLALGLIVQMMLTFSRGGLWTLVGALLVAGFFFIRDQRSRAAYLIAMIIGVFILSSYILPALDRWTSGVLGTRLTDFDTTGRIEIARADLEAFAENPVFGVGVGESRLFHARYFRVAHAHTEFTRMLAEHGSFGALSLIIFLWVLAKKVFSEKFHINRALVASSITWALLFMAHSATRLVAPSFMIGLAFARFSLTGDEQLEDPPETEKAVLHEPHL